MTIACNISCSPTVIIFFITVTLKYNYEIPVTQSACFLFSHNTRVKPGQAPGSLILLDVHCSLPKITKVFVRHDLNFNK